MNKKLGRTVYDWKQIATILRAVCNHIENIKVEEGPELVELYIEAIEGLMSFIDNPLTIKERIRIGQGNFKAVKQKCIDMGIV